MVLQETVAESNRIMRRTLAPQSGRFIFWDVLGWHTESDSPFVEESPVDELLASGAVYCCAWRPEWLSRRLARAAGELAVCYG